MIDANESHVVAENAKVERRQHISKRQLEVFQ